MTTLQDAIKALQFLKTRPRFKTKIADRLLGQYKGVVPKGKTSSQLIRNLRNTLYGKVK